MLGGDELEIHSVDNGPHLPGSLACAKEVVLDLVANGREGVSVDKSEVGKVDNHEQRAPKDLINGNLESNLGGLRSFNLGVKPVVKEVSGGSVVEQSKHGKSDETLDVEWIFANENLLRGGEARSVESRAKTLDLT